MSWLGEVFCGLPRRRFVISALDGLGRSVGVCVGSIVTVLVLGCSEACMYLPPRRHQSPYTPEFAEWDNCTLGLTPFFEGPCVFVVF